MRAHLARRAEVLAPSSSFKVPSYPAPNRSSSSSSSYLITTTTLATGAEADGARTARLSRETSERARAEALRARKRRELEAGSETASSIGGDGTPRSEWDYRDVFNVRETREAGEARERGWVRGRHHWGSKRWDEEEEESRDDGRSGSSRVRRVDGSSRSGYDRRR